MTRQASVRCPAESCRTTFVLSPARLGRSTYCPRCGVRMTARPISVEEQLRSQEARVRGGAGSTLERLPIVVLLDNIRSLWNVGSIFRTADGCGVERLVLTGITGCPPRREVTKTALGAEEAVAWEYRADAAEALAVAVARGYEPVALEATDDAVPIDSFAWPARPLLVVGNEVAGVSDAVLAACPRRLAIPMLGAKSSFNVAVAFGIAAFHAASALRGERACE